MAAERHERRPKLKPCHRHYRYDGQRLTCIVVHDPMSGHGVRYDVLALTLDDPVVIGRELTLRDAQEIIADYERVAADVLDGRADRRSEVIRCLRRVCRRTVRVEDA